MRVKFSDKGHETDFAEDLARDASLQYDVLYDIRTSYYHAVTVAAVVLLLMVAAAYFGWYAEIQNYLVAPLMCGFGVFLILEIASLWQMFSAVTAKISVSRAEGRKGAAVRNVYKKMRIEPNPEPPTQLTNVIDAEPEPIIRTKAPGVKVIPMERPETGSARTTGANPEPVIRRELDFRRILAGLLPGRKRHALAVSTPAIPAGQSRREYYAQFRNFAPVVAAPPPIPSSATINTDIVQARWEDPRTGEEKIGSVPAKLWQEFCHDLYVDTRQRFWIARWRRDGYSSAEAQRFHATCRALALQWEIIQIMGGRGECRPVYGSYDVMLRTRPELAQRFGLVREIN